MSQETFGNFTGTHLHLHGTNFLKISISDRRIYIKRLYLLLCFSFLVDQILNKNVLFITF